MAAPPPPPPPADEASPLPQPGDLPRTFFPGGTDAFSESDLFARTGQASSSRAATGTFASEDGSQQPSQERGPVRVKRRFPTMNKAGAAIMTGVRITAKSREIEAKRINESMGALTRIHSETKIASLQKLHDERAEALQPHASKIAGLLWHNDTAVRENAARTLSASREIAARHATVQASRLACQDSRARLKAARALLQMGAAGADAAARQLAHRRPEVRAAAAGVLGKLPDREHAAPHMGLVTTLLHDDMEFVRFTAMEALGNLGDAAGEYAQDLFHCIWDDNPVVRKQAATQLGRMGYDAVPFAEELAREFLGSAGREMGVPKIKAIEALSCMGTVGADVLADYLRHLDECVRLSAIDALGQMPKTDFAPRLHSLATCLFDEDKLVRARAVEVMGSAGAAALDHAWAIVSLHWDGEPAVRQAAMDAMQVLVDSGELTPERLQELIEEGTEDARVRGLNGAPPKPDYGTIRLLDALQDDR